MSQPSRARSNSTQVVHSGSVWSTLLRLAIRQVPKMKSKSDSPPDMCSSVIGSRQDTCLDPITEEHMSGGESDFDFIFGTWRIANRRRVDQTDPECTTWVEFERARDGCDMGGRRRDRTTPRPGHS